MRSLHSTWLMVCVLISLVGLKTSAAETALPMQLQLPAEAPSAVRDVQQRVYRAAQRQAHYLLGTVHAWPEDETLRLLTESKSGEHWIRPNAGAVEGFAFLHRFGPYDAQAVGISRAELRDDKDRFEVQLVVDHGDSVQARLGFRSEPDGSFVMTETLVALTDVKTAEVATGLIGVLNNPHWIHESGRRRVEVGDERLEVASGCGQTWQWEAALRIAIDDALRVESPRPLQIAYLASERPERGRVTDRLILNYLPGERAWAQGQTISRYEVAVRCGE